MAPAQVTNLKHCCPAFQVWHPWHPAATPSKRPKPLEYEIIDNPGPQQRHHKRHVMRHSHSSHYHIECRRQRNADGIAGIHPPQAAPISTDIRTKGKVSMRGMPYDNRQPEPNGPTHGRIANVEKEMDRQVDEQLYDVAQKAR